MKRNDIFDVQKRATIMRAVKSRDTEPERVVRAAVRALGYGRRYRLNGAHLPGKPDLVFGALRKVIFVHGCFWHGHACSRGARQPKDNAAYWRAKIERNRARDEAAIAAVRNAGWKALVLWECEIKEAAPMARKLKAFLREPPQASRRPKGSWPLSDPFRRRGAPRRSARRD